MRAGPRLRLQLLAQNGLFAALLVAAAFLALYLLRDSALQWDITQNKRGSLSAATRDVLRAMNGPITITAYATVQDPQLGDLRRIVSDFVAPYRRIKPDITLAFVDPNERPKETAAANVRANGEMVIAYGTRKEHLTALNEQSMANLLMRLSRSQERLVMFVDGHGEPRLDGNANFDLGQFGQQLQLKGFRVQALNLSVAPEVPGNAALLVLTHPRADMLAGEVAKLVRHVERGGNLLWLIEQEPLRGLQPLVERLGLRLEPGVLVDPTAAQLGLQATIALSSNYGHHPITEAFTRYNTAFPFARAIGFPEEGSAWQATVLVEAGQNGWVETGALEGDIRLDPGRDVPGPATVAVAFERERDNGTSQRIVVIGGSGFLSNAFVGLLSNLDFGVNVLNWLSADENLITIQPRERVDASLQVTRGLLTALVFGFLLLLPGAFLAAGATIWWRRRRA